MGRTTIHRSGHEKTQVKSSSVCDGLVGAWCAAAFRTSEGPRRAAAPVAGPRPARHFDEKNIRLWRLAGYVVDAVERAVRTPIAALAPIGIGRITAPSNHPRTPSAASSRPPSGCEDRGIPNLRKTASAKYVDAILSPCFQAWGQVLQNLYGPALTKFTPGSDGEWGRSQPPSSLRQVRRPETCSLSQQ